MTVFKALKAPEVRFTRYCDMLTTWEEASNTLGSAQPLLKQRLLMRYTQGQGFIGLIRFGSHTLCLKEFSRIPLRNSVDTVFLLVTSFRHRSPVRIKLLLNSNCALKAAL